MSEQAKNKKYAVVFGIVFVVLLALYAVAMVVIDPYEVFGACKIFSGSILPNERYLKTEHLLKDGEKYNAFVLGASRTNFYDAQTANRLTGKNFYNLSVASERVEGMVTRAEWVLDRYEKPYIVAGLDLDLMLKAPIPDVDLQRTEHPLISGSGNFKFFLKYFGYYPKPIMQVVKHRIRGTTYISFSAREGSFELVEDERAYRENPEKYIKNDFKYIVPRGAVPLENVELLRTRLEDMREFCELLDARAGGYTLVVNPCYYPVAEKYPDDLYAEWISSIVSSCGSVWDFSGYNSITTDRNNYYESSHFKKYVGDIVLEKVFAGRKDPEDFGRLVTSDNLEEHIQSFTEKP